MKKKTKTWIAVCLCLVAALGVATGVYANDYYRAENVSAYFLGEDMPAVRETDEGWYFDGPGTENALLFYAGAKVEETAYAPLMQYLTAQGVDCFLLKAPMKLPFFSVSKAESVMKQYPYAHYYLAGHSLGGMVAANDAAKHPQDFSGLFLLAAYPTEDLTAAEFPVVFLYGTNDDILNQERLERGYSLVPEGYQEVEIDGGNHSGFASYGTQKNDGEATVSAAEQQKITGDTILETVKP